VKRIVANQNAVRPQPEQVLQFHSQQPGNIVPLRRRPARAAKQADGTHDCPHFTLREKCLAAEVEQLIEPPYQTTQRADGPHQGSAPGDGASDAHVLGRADALASAAVSVAARKARRSMFILRIGSPLAAPGGCLDSMVE
jgi:hypothetical protein